MLELFDNFNEVTKVTTLVNYLHEKGFKDYPLPGEVVYGLQGEIEGEKRIIAILYLPISEKVKRIKAKWPVKQNWNLIKEDYLNLKEQFTNTYGRPAYVKEMFLDPSLEEDDEDNVMIAVKNDDFIYNSIWGYKNNMLDLWIEPDIIILSYDNLTNCNLYHEEIDELEKMLQE